MTSTVIPCLRYRDAPRMLEWLCEVVGFARHADLTLGAGMIMLGSARDGDDPFG
jgi:uncharacterized glyoxalase superfamily protein PhnB